MKVQIEKVFAMPASADLTWQFLQDIAAVGACMPGAKITERVDEAHYKGTVTVKVGPATMSFRGDIEVRELDVTTRTLRLLGKGSDTTGTSGASIDLVARVEAAEGGKSNLLGKSDASVSGKAAAFGGRMMNAVADQVLQQFAANFATQVALLKAAQTGAAPAASAPPAQRELNGLALFWALVKNWIRGLFSKQQG
jgi:carbon monoxide dehydrogenase subunit G